MSARKVLIMGGLTALLAAWWSRIRRRPTPSLAEGGPTTEHDPKTPDVEEPKAAPPPTPDTTLPPGANGKPPKPIAVGVPGDPEIDALLAEMDALFEAHGVDTSLMSAREVTLMSKTPSRASAIPPRAYWPRMARTLAETVMPLRTGLAFPMTYGGYRPEDYNAAVGGAPKSRHMWFEGVDVRPAPAVYTADNRRKLALAGAALYNARGKSLKMGLGVYGQNTPSNIHVDAGHRRRTWRDADHWVQKAKTVS